MVHSSKRGGVAKEGLGEAKTSTARTIYQATTEGHMHKKTTWIHQIFVNSFLKR